MQTLSKALIIRLKCNLEKITKSKKILYRSLCFFIASIFISQAYCFNYPDDNNSLSNPLQELILAYELANCDEEEQLYEAYLSKKEELKQSYYISLVASNVLMDEITKTVSSASQTTFLGNINNSVDIDKTSVFPQVIGECKGDPDVNYVKK